MLGMAFINTSAAQLSGVSSSASSVRREFQKVENDDSDGVGADDGGGGVGVAYSAVVERVGNDIGVSFRLTATVTNALSSPLGVARDALLHIRSLLVRHWC